MANDRNAPATKGDLDDPETRLKAERGVRLTGTMRDIQTELPKAFDSLTQTVPVRFRAQENATANTGKRLTVLEERVPEIDRRLNTPPAV